MTNDATKSYSGLKVEFKVQARLMYFNLIEYTMFSDVVSNFILQINL